MCPTSRTSVVSEPLAISWPEKIGSLEMSEFMLERSSSSWLSTWEGGSATATTPVQAPSPAFTSPTCTTLMQYSFSRLFARQTFFTVVLVRFCQTLHLGEPGERGQFDGQPSNPYLELGCALFCKAAPQSPGPAPAAWTSEPETCSWSPGSSLCRRPSEEKGAQRSFQ